MKIAVVGLGYVGVTAACCLASQGHRIIGVDVSSKKVDELNRGVCPITEPGLSELLTRALDQDLIKASTSFPASNRDIDMVIVCVGTPSGPDGSHNMSYVAEATRQVASALDRDRDKPLTLVFRSTFRPGTMEELITPILRDSLGDDYGSIVERVYNPEFLRESSAIDDFFNPPRVVVGTADARASTAMDEMNSGIDAETFNVGFREAEFTKFADNTWHAVKVSFANEVGRVCQELGIDPQAVHRIFVADRKLNISPYYTRPGGPFGGSCLPKDVRALQHIASDAGVNSYLIDALIKSNEAHKHFLYQRVVALLPATGRVLVSGLAFKAGTDDLRESPNVDIVRRLLRAGHTVHVFDPSLAAERLVGQNLGYAYTHLPSLGDLLVDQKSAETGDYDLAVKTNASFDLLDLGDTPTIDIGTLR
ncbi:nucleotide sugar dehydrogenase [Nocardioides hankookensis]|uniref:UDP-glucose 6-dehydrogenase n=1 Tax=Nocardioides hankookensis TaxID=443157 RepID=A0ABW1LMN2_9ACTN